MKIHVERTNMETGGALASRKFGIRSGPLLLQMLSSLYSDPKRAVVREYGTNMLDAYARLPKDDPKNGLFRKPPQIILPSKMDPTLTFKDFGRGMAFEEVWNVFGDYAASTKNDSNDEVGGLGIGAKTAFCYAGDQAWIVESRFNGERMIFHAVKDSEGNPTLNHMGTLPTDEPNGVTVIIPIRNGDFDAFRTEVQWFSRYFPMELEVIGAGFAKPPLNYTLRGNSWGLFERQRHHHYDHGNHCVMGNIPYELDLRQIRDKIGLSHEHLTDFRVDFYVPVGSVDIAPNREALMYTDRTIARLKQAVEEFFAEIRAEATSAIAACETEWDALSTLYTFSKFTSIRTMLSDIEWRGTTLNLLHGMRIEIEELRRTIPGLTVKVMRTVEGVRRSTMRLTGLLHDPEMKEITFRPSENRYIFLNDVEKHLSYRIGSAMKDLCRMGMGRHSNPIPGTAYVIEAPDLDEDTLFSLLRGLPKADVLHYASEGDAPPEPVKKIRSGGVASIRRFYKHGHSEQECFPGIDTDTADGGVFVRLKGSDPYEYRGLTELRSLFTLATKCGFLAADSHLFGLTRNVQRVETLPKWIEFRAHLTKAVTKYMAKHGQRVVDYETWIEVMESPLAAFLNQLDAKALPANTLGREVVERTQAFWKDQLVLASVLDLVGLLKLPMPTLPVQHNGKALFQQFTQKYPMLGLVGQVASGDTVATTTEMAKKWKNVVTDYIKAA